MAEPNPKVDAFFDKAKNWQAEFRAMRSIVLDYELTEELKWGKPCYAFGKQNLIIIQGFKEFCALLFTNGALLNDPKKLLEVPGENTQSARRLRFTHVDQINQQAGAIHGLIAEAVAAEKSGLKVTLKSIDEYERPAELESRLQADASLKAAFAALTPGRQRAYLMHIGSAKQSKTRESRVEKCVPLILAGKGLND